MVLFNISQNLQPSNNQFKSNQSIKTVVQTSASPYSFAVFFVVVIESAAKKTAALLFEKRQIAMKFHYEKLPVFPPHQIELKTSEFS